MRSLDGHIEARLAYAGGADPPGIKVTNPSQGVWDIRVVDRRYRLVGLSPTPAGSGSGETIVSYALAENPQRAQISFLTSAGVAGAYGGYYTAILQRRTV